jgi:hypothetical protein
VNLGQPYGGYARTSFATGALKIQDGRCAGQLSRASHPPRYGERPRRPGRGLPPGAGRPPRPPGLTPRLPLISPRRCSVSCRSVARRVRGAEALARLKVSLLASSLCCSWITSRVGWLRRVVSQFGQLELHLWRAPRSSPPPDRSLSACLGHGFGQVRRRSATCAGSCRDLGDRDRARGGAGEGAAGIVFVGRPLSFPASPREN